MRILVCAPGPNFSVMDVYKGWVDAFQALGQHTRVYNLDTRLAFFNAAYLAMDDPEQMASEPAQPGRFRKALTVEQAIQCAMDGLPAELFAQRPDVLFIVSGFFFCIRDTSYVNILDQARRSGTKVVVLHTESPYEDDRQLWLAEHADLNLVNDDTNIERFRQVALTEYQPHCYRPAVHHPGRPVAGMESDFAFVGTAFPSRIKFFEAMNLDGIDVALGGHWQFLPDGSPLHKHLAHDLQMCMDNHTTADAYRSTKASINLYRQEFSAPAKPLPGDMPTPPTVQTATTVGSAGGRTCGPREIELAACQTFFLRDPRPESDELFPMLPGFAGPEDASEKLRWWLAHDLQRRRVARQARQAIEDRTFENAAKALLRRLDS